MDFSFVQTPGFNAFLAALTVFSLAFAFYSHHRNTVNQKLLYNLDGNKIYDESERKNFNIPRLKYDDIEIRQLYRFRLFIANEGSVAIEPIHLVEGNRIRIICNDTGVLASSPHILRCQVDEYDDANGNFSIEVSPPDASNPSIDLCFDYIAPKTGVILEGIASFNPSKFQIQANTKNYGPIRNVRIITPSDYMLLMFIMILIIGSLFAIGWVYIVFIPDQIAYYFSPSVETDNLIRRFLGPMGLPIMLTLAVFFGPRIYNRIAKRVMRRTNIRWEYG